MSAPKEEPTTPEYLKHMAEACDKNDGKPVTFSFKTNGISYFIDVYDVTQAHLELSSCAILEIH